MIKSVTIENFRSIEAAEIALAPLVVLYGPTVSGKSSLLYALLVLKNFIVNPSRPADGYFHLGFMDLGGFEQCVFNHEDSRKVTAGVTFEEKEGPCACYKLSFSKNKATICQQWGNIVLGCEIPVPYGLNQTFSFGHSEANEEYAIN